MNNSESLVPYDGMNRIRCNGLDSQPAHKKCADTPTSKTEVSKQKNYLPVACVFVVKLIFSNRFFGILSNKCFQRGRRYNARLCGDQFAFRVK